MSAYGNLETKEKSKCTCSRLRECPLAKISINTKLVWEFQTDISGPVRLKIKLCTIRSFPVVFFVVVQIVCMKSERVTIHLSRYRALRSVYSAINSNQSSTSELY